MVLDHASVPTGLGAAETLAIRSASPADVALVTSITAAAFDQDEESFRRRYAREIEEPNIRFFLAFENGQPMGALRLISFGPTVFITAFGVLPAYRRRGFGREMLFRTVRLLFGEGWRQIEIEVVTDNRNALDLYRSCGFRETMTYAYFGIVV
jgi:ribosomal protein S18 acetylase RimI-like enzyme